MYNIPRLKAFYNSWILTTWCTCVSFKLFFDYLEKSYHAFMVDGRNLDDLDDYDKEFEAEISECFRQPETSESHPRGTRPIIWWVCATGS